MSLYKNIITNLPEVAPPTQKVLSFKEKLKWTGIVIVLFFILGLLPLFGLGKNALEQFEFLSIILAAQFGSIISLGIGPIVTSSIVLQLLNGSGIVKFDLTTTEGKKTFQGTQKLLSFFFILFEAIIYVFMGGLSPEGFGAAAGFVGITKATNPQMFFYLQLLLVFQLFLGGILIMFMDEVISKWGFGSGISLFIAAGVSQSIFWQALSWVKRPGVEYSVGAIPALVQALGKSDLTYALVKISALLSTAFVFMLAVYAQAMKIEIPLSFGMVRGQGIRWPLSFIYTSNIPVILVSALMANFQLWGRLIQNWLQHGTWFATFDTTGQLRSGLVYWLNSPELLRIIIEGKGLLGITPYLQALSYVLFMILGSVIFSLFWVQTAGMDAKTVSKQMLSSGLQIPGFRKDERILETILNRYIWPLTVMGAITVGLLASLADLSSALSRGTGILLTVMIVYKLYEDIAKQHAMDMNPMLKKIIS